MEDIVCDLYVFFVIGGVVEDDGKMGVSQKQRNHRFDDVRRWKIKKKDRKERGGGIR
jgi:hypothetical protein